MNTSIPNWANPHSYLRPKGRKYRFQMPSPRPFLVRGFLGVLTLGVAVQVQAQSSHMEAIGFSHVQITDAFWSPRIDKVSNVTIPVCIQQTEVKTPRIRNFEKVARRACEKHEGIYFDDSDVYKALEAMAYSLKNHPDKTLEARAD